MRSQRKRRVKTIFKDIEKTKRDLTNNDYVDMLRMKDGFVQSIVRRNAPIDLQLLCYLRLRA